MTKKFLNRLDSPEEAELFIRLVRKDTSSHLLSIQNLYDHTFGLILELNRIVGSTKAEDSAFVFIDI
jgi:hypothetical protein